jgi:hypothetical protein
MDNIIDNRPIIRIKWGPDLKSQYYVSQEVSVGAAGTAIVTRIVRDQFEYLKTGRSVYHVYALFEQREVVLRSSDGLPAEINYDATKQ